VREARIVLVDPRKGSAMIVTEKVKDVATAATPAVQRLAKDEKFQQNVKSAYGSARSIYDELFVEGPPATETTAKRIVAKLAVDPELQNELRSVFHELQEAGKRAKKAAKPPSYKKRNALIMAGIVIGILYNPATGPDTRKWLKERIFGPEETFEYEP
jgi:hypothetical protein